MSTVDDATISEAEPPGATPHHHVLGRRRLLTSAASVAAVATLGVALDACSSDGADGASSQSGGSGTTAAAGATTTPAPTLPRPQTPEEALEALEAGNARFAQRVPLYPNQSAELRQSFTDTQKPFIGVLACADSRVIPELIFDQGISDVFDVRVAGNIAAPADVSSLVYAVEVLGVDLITVMGHSNCGAVAAAIDVSTGAMEPGEFAPLTDAIQPAVEAAQPTSNTGEQLEKTIEANARIQAEALTRASPALAAAVEAGTLTIIPSVYDLSSGKVRLLT